MNGEIIIAIYEVLKDAFKTYRKAQELAKQYNVAQIRPRTFILRGTRGAFLRWPAPHGFHTVSAENYFAVSSDSDSKRLGIHSTETVMPHFIYDIVGKDERAALRVLRQAEALRAWVKAREEGIQRAIDEIKSQRARFHDTLEAEIALRKLGGMP